VLARRGDSGGDGNPKAARNTPKVKIRPSTSQSENPGSIPGSATIPKIIRLLKKPNHLGKPLKVTLLLPEAILGRAC
jgi:hypothetical protein